MIKLCLALALTLCLTTMSTAQDTPEQRTAIRPYFPEPTAYASETPTAAIIPPPPEEPALVSLGTFKAYAYCPCRKCCGKWSGGPTASGVMPEEGRTIAVDPDVIPLGTVVYIDGCEYVAEDTGSGIDGQTIDIYHDDHDAALQWGVQYVEIWTEG